MIVGFSKHGKGGGRGPTEYLTDEKKHGREDAPPAVVRGDKDATRRLIDSLDFKNKYTSGVLSFAPGETITPEMERAIMDRFEQVAYAGLQPDQYNILWVRHAHAGHHELHFVTPRVELSTGKSLNIRPPGELAKRHFDDFRSEINARYGLADPTDPDRERRIKMPNHDLKKAAEAIRLGEKPKENIRGLVDELLTQRAENGLIQNRDEVINAVKELGFTVPRAGKNYITIEADGKKMRMKGALYERDYQPGTTLENANQKRERDYSKPDPERAERFAKRVEKNIGKRAEYNRERYKSPEQENRLEHSKEQNIMASNDRSLDLSGFIRRELGSDAIPLDRNKTDAIHSELSGKEGRENTVQPMYGREKTGIHMSESGREQRDIRNTGRSMDGTRGALKDDGTGNSLIERLQTIGESIQRAASSFTESAKRFTQNVRAYFAREHELTKSSRTLEQASIPFDHSIKQIDKKIELQIQRTRGHSLGR